MRVSTLSIVMVVACLTSVSVFAHELPRTADGKPNLNGVWQVLNSANYNLEAHSAKPAMMMRPGPHGPVPAIEVVALGAVGAVPAGLGVVVDGPIPYLPKAIQQKRDNAANWLTKDPEVKCYLPGVPRATYQPFPFQIHQSESAIAITYEFAGAVRNLYLKDPGEAPVDSWMGQSFARWEDDTLVVEVTGFNDSTWFDRAGNYHSAAMKVTEYYRLISPGVMEYEALIEDENVFERPWRIRMPVYKRVGPDAQLLQFKCVEFVEELLYGHLRKTPLEGAKQ